LSKAQRIVDVVLTKLAVGYKNAAMIATRVLPVVFCSKEGVKIPVYGKDAFKLVDTQRAQGSDSNQLIRTPKSTVDAVLEEHDISIPIDWREKDESDFNDEADAVEEGGDILDLGLEKETADLLTNPDNYAASMKVALTTSFDEEGGDPVGVIDTGIEAIRQKLGKRPNKLVFGQKTMNILKHHDDLIARLPNTKVKVLNESLIAEVFDVEEVIVGGAVYDDDGTMTDVWGDIVLIGYTPKNPRSYRVPSGGFILRKKGFRQADKYPGAGGKVTNVRSTDVRTPKVVVQDAWYLITNTKA